MSTPRRRPTIADVARRAGVSQAAVSFAVNDRPGVGPETRERILAAARELGWRPSASARALTEARTRAIGLVFARDPERLEGDSFFMRFLTGLERTLSPRDYALLLQLVPPGDAGLRANERLAAAGRVDGFLLTDPVAGDPRFRPLADAGVDAVVAGRPAGECPFPWVETDHAAGMTAATAHLAQLGHTRVGFLGGPAALEHVQARLGRWRGALASARLEPGPVALVEPADAGRAAGSLLDEGVTAIACTSDLLALAAVATARERGLAVPRELSVTGFDDSPLAALATPALTSVHVDYAEFGAAVAAALLAQIEGGPVPAYAPSAPELVVRASTSAPAR